MLLCGCCCAGERHPSHCPQRPPLPVCAGQRCTCCGLPCPALPPLLLQVSFIPVTALNGYNIKERVTKESCDWYEGGTLFEVSAARRGGVGYEGGS